VRRLLPATIDWPETPHLCSLTLDSSIDAPEDACTLRFGAGTLAALGAGGEVLGEVTLTPDGLRGAESGSAFRIGRPYRRLGRVTRLALENHNPIAEFEAHPDKAGNAIDLGGRSVEEWSAALEVALAIVEQHLPGIHAEMGTLLHELIPVGYHAERHLSASYREAIGTVYLTLHGNAMTMAEALVHEFQHNKMNVASYSIDFLENPFHPRYPSPVRPDPRPLWGILLAVHAFLPVAQLYRNMRDAGHPWAARPDFLRRMSEIDLKNHEGMEMLRAHAKWLPAGRAFFGELEALERAHLAERAAQGLATRPTEVHLA
jgi:HEXXH motif-containing protein